MSSTNPSKDSSRKFLSRKAAGRNSVTMSRNRNIRRKAFGYPDYNYTIRDRNWPT